MRVHALSANVFEYDPELLADLAVDVVDDLVGRGAVEVVAYPKGPVSLAGHHQSGFGLLLLDGFVCREAAVAGRSSVELMGRGDVLRPWQDGRAEAPVPVESSFRALTSVSLGHLGRDFVARVAPWPQVTEALCARVFERTRWLALQLALTRVRRIEDRLLVLLWHLADRWGRVERDGTIVCPVPVTHELLAGMLAAQRPSVTSAFALLASQGRVEKHPEGWLLMGAPPSASEFEGKALADAFRLRREDD